MDVVVGQELLGGEEEGDMSRWLVQDGSNVTQGQALAELETSKVLVQVEAPTAGVVTFVASEGDVVGPDTVIARIAG
ncbi:MAG TPA: lipoyl domain-containing protein [Terrimesophilobacter sp.]|nr:lipoyl domain-containing protein [Terrimesophilobacter sp.]